jgi:hypothetical protein
VNESHPTQSTIDNHNAQSVSVSAGLIAGSIVAGLELSAESASSTLCFESFSFAAADKTAPEMRTNRKGEHLPGIFDRVDYIIMGKC